VSVVELTVGSWLWLDGEAWTVHELTAATGTLTASDTRARVVTLPGLVTQAVC